MRKVVAADEQCTTYPSMHTAHRLDGYQAGDLWMTRDYLAKQFFIILPYPLRQWPSNIIGFCLSKVSPVRNSSLTQSDRKHALPGSSVITLIPSKLKGTDGIEQRVILDRENGDRSNSLEKMGTNFG
jgi:hypothetical protein